VTIPKCSRGKGTIEKDVRTLKVNVREYDLDMQLIYKGNNYIQVLNICLKGL
jgi:hypothetical protein